MQKLSDAARTTVYAPYIRWAIKNARILFYPSLHLQDNILCFITDMMMITIIYDDLLFNWYTILIFVKSNIFWMKIIFDEISTQRVASIWILFTVVKFFSLLYFFFNLVLFLPLSPNTYGLLITHCKWALSKLEFMANSYSWTVHAKDLVQAPEQFSRCNL